MVAALSSGALLYLMCMQRRSFRWLSGCLVRCMLFFWGFHWVHVRGRKASRYRAPLITMAPHSTFFDVLPVICMGDVSVVTKKENLDVPIIGSMTHSILHSTFYTPLSMLNETNIFISTEYLFSKMCAYSTIQYLSL